MSFNISCEWSFFFFKESIPFLKFLKTFISLWNHRFYPKCGVYSFIHEGQQGDPFAF